MMPRLPGTRCIAIVLALVCAGTLAAPAWAQDQAPPPAQAPVMQNVFYNVIWGSAFGALLGFASAIESSSDKAKPTNARGNAFEGATLGGLLGLGLGIYLVYAGITFEPAGSTIIQAGPTPGDPVAFQPKDLTPGPGEAAMVFGSTLAAAAQPRFSLETAPGQPGKITGFRALVMDIRF